MALQKGRQQYLAIKPEATRYTAETTGFTKFLPWSDFSFQNENGYENDESAMGTRGKLLNKVLATQYGSFSFGSKVDADNILLPLYHFFGSATPTTADGATTWAFAMLQNIELPTFTAQYSRGDEGARRMVGCMVNTLNLTFGLDDSKYTVDGFGISEEAGNALTVATTKPARYLLGRHTSIKLADNIAGLGAASTLGIQSIEITGVDGVDAIRAQELGSVKPELLTADGVSLMITFDVLVSTANQAADLQTWHDTGVKKALEIDVHADDLPVIGTSALKPRLTLRFPESTVKVTNSVALDDLIKKTVEIEIERPELVTGTLINAIASL